MKQLVLSIVFVLAASLANAQESKTFYVAQPCDPVEKMIATLDRYGETPLFVGNGIQIGAQANIPYRGGAMFFVNQETGTWSLISVYADGNACMVSNGTDFEPYTGR